jgi:hypothetical protein
MTARLLVLGLCLCVTFVSAQQVPVAAGVITGRVTTTVSGQAVPVRRARVTLIAAAGPVVTDTNTDGAFRAEGLPPGSYRITVEKPGFVTAVANATANVDVRMDRAGAIEGKLIDEAGEPVTKMIVSALQPNPSGGAPTIVRQAKTDDLGRFRIHTLPAGEFVIEAGAPEKTYYPGTPNIADARAVRVALGEDVRAVEFVLASTAAMPSAPVPAGQNPAVVGAGSGQISGRVTAAKTGRPIRAASVRIVRWEGVTGAQTSTGTDAQGRFVFPSLRDGRYQLSVTADGYVPLELGQRSPREAGRPIDLAAGQTLDSADVALPRTSGIEGRLVDEFGDPAPGVLVQVARVEFAAGRSRLMPIGDPNQVLPTDDLGQFRASGLAAGDYYLVALSGPFANEDRAGFAPTFYPGTTSPRDARATHVDTDQDVIGLQMTLSPASSVTLSGRAMTPAGAPAASGLLLLQTHDGDIRAFLSARGRSGADGAFSIRNVPAGSYVLQAFQPPTQRGAGGFGGFGSVQLTVNADRPDLDVIVASGSTARGRISFEGAAPLPPIDRVRLLPRPVDFISGPVFGAGLAPTVVRDDWTFELARNFGRVALRADAPQPWGLKSITHNGLDVTDSALDFSKDIDGLEVVLTTQLAGLTGRVMERNVPIQDCAVVIFSNDTTKWAFPSRHVVMQRPAQDGRFTAQRLPPGSYRVVALPAVGSEWQDPEFLGRLRARALEITLGGGQTQTIEVELLRQ